jgi:hypothetical protein
MHYSHKLTSNRKLHVTCMLRDVLRVIFTGHVAEIICSDFEGDDKLFRNRKATNCNATQMGKQDSSKQHLLLT